MSKVRRWAHTVTWEGLQISAAYMAINDGGEYVMHDDYAALEAECSRLRAALGQYADDNNWRYDTCNISRDVAKDALAAGGGCI